MVNYLDLSNEFVVLVVLCVREFIDFDFVLLNLFHYLVKKQSNQNEMNNTGKVSIQAVQKKFSVPQATDTKYFLEQIKWILYHLSKMNRATAKSN